MIISRLLTRSLKSQRFFSSLQNIQDLRLKIDSFMSQKDLPSVESHLLTLMSSLPSLSSKETQNLSKYLLTYGQSMASLNKSSLANQLALKSQSLIDSLEEPSLVITFTMYSLCIFSLTESYSEALSLLESKKNLASALETSKLKGDFFENLGKLKMQLSDLHGALSNFSEAFSIFSDLNDKFSVFRCRVYMSVIHHKSGSTDSAKHEMSLCTTYLLQEKFILKGESLEPISLWLMNLITFAADPSDQQKTIQNILTAFESHPIDSQFSLIENFLETIQKSKQKKLGVFISQLFLQFLQKNYQEKPGTIARALYFAANEQAKAGAFSSAIQLAEDCLKIQERIGHKYNMAMTLNLLMQIQMRNDDWNSAYSYLERFGKIAKETGDESLLKLYSDYKSL